MLGVASLLGSMICTVGRPSCPMRVRAGISGSAIIELELYRLYIDEMHTLVLPADTSRSSCQGSRDLGRVQSFGLAAFCKSKQNTELGIPSGPSR